MNFPLRCERRRSNAARERPFTVEKFTFFVEKLTGHVDVNTQRRELLQKNIHIYIYLVKCQFARCFGIAHAPGKSSAAIHFASPEESSMRSDLVFGASAHVPNRYQLTRLVAMATRALHHPGTRVQDTMNDVLTRFGQAAPVAYLQPVEESPARAIRRRKPPVRRSSEAALKREQMVVDQPVQVSRPAVRSSFSPFNSAALPPGVLFTTFNPMPTERSKQ
jgi:hypothetical protein